MVIKQLLIIIIIILISSFFSYAETFEIRNIGNLGFNDTNQEYTPIRVVSLHITIDLTATKCRYNESNVAWTNFENCKENKYWVLSSDEGLKIVNVQINHTNGSIFNYTDTITFDHTGFGLDLTPPSKVNITYNRFINSNNSLNIEFNDASDPESNILKIPLVYDYQIFYNNIFNVTGDANSKKIEFNLSVNQTFNQSDNITIRIITKNSAGLNSTTEANVTIDYTKPSEVIVNSNIIENIWSNNNTIFFNWSSYDNISGIKGYSYIFSEDINLYPDNSIEIDERKDLNFTNITFFNIKTINTGKYKFRIKAKDFAGNFGDVSTYNVWIDTIPPTKPTITSFKKIEGIDITNFTWSESFDFESGISNYTIEFSNESDFSNILNNYTTPNNSTFYYEYTSPDNYPTIYARVYATDKVGNIGKDSNSDTNYDTIPPVITLIRPKGRVDSVLPTIALYTNEKAICYVKKQDNTYEKFSYTNETFHETQPQETTSTKRYDLKCEDSYGNKVEDFTTFLDPGSITLTTPPTINSYVDKNIKINISTNLGEIKKEDIIIYINDSIVDFTIFDSGEGNYILGLNPLNKIGVYDVKVSIKGNLALTTLIINTMTLVARYDFSGINAAKYEKIGYYETPNMKAGFASDASISVINAGTNSIEINSSSDGKIYIFTTKRSQNLEVKDKYFKDQSFYLNKNPSFGYSFLDDYILKLSLNYKNINIVGYETLNQGDYSLIIKRLKNDTKKTILISSEISNYNNKGVKQYG